MTSPETPAIAQSQFDRPKTSIFIQGAGAIIRPPLPESTARLLRAENLEFAPGTFCPRRPVQWFVHFEHEQTIIMAGLVPRVVDSLKDLGHEVDVVMDFPSRPRLRKKRSLKAYLNDRESEFVAAVENHARGVIVASTKRTRIRYVALLARSYPEAKISFVTKSRRKASSLRFKLERLMTEPVELLNQGGYVLTDARLTVCTWAGLDERDADIIIFHDAVDVLPKRVRGTLIRVKNNHVYGFTDRDCELSPCEKLSVEGLIGPVFHDATDKLRLLFDARVFLASSPTSDRRPRASSLERKRQEIWHSGRRNEAVAEVARAFAALDLNSLWRHGLLLGMLTADDDFLGRKRIAVPVESPKHGRALAKHLPGWPLLEREPCRPLVQPIPSADREAVESPPPLPPLSIMTRLRAMQCETLDLDVLIRAEGGCSPLDLPAFSSRRGNMGSMPLWVVDFKDDGEEADRRLSDYARRGWSIDAPRPWMKHQAMEIATSKSNRRVKNMSSRIDRALA